MYRAPLLVLAFALCRSAAFVANPSTNVGSFSAPQALQHHPRLHHRRLGLSATSSVPTSPALTTLVEESCSKDYVLASASSRAVAWAGAVGAAGLVGAVELPYQLRLLVGAVLVFAAFEYGFHRWVMHSDRDAFADYQNLHVTHHTETQRDMTLDGGQGSDPRHIYFSLKTTAASVAICAAALGVLNGAFDLHFGATAAEATAHVGCVSVLVALWHTAHWQTIHGDIHEYYTDPEDGLPRVNALSAESPYTRWVVANHVGHHVVRGAGNFNIVFPGPDHLFGTAFVARRGE